MDSTEFRAIVGCFATGVTVVTTNVGGELHGMTANAFTSLSLEPLQVLVCVGKSGTCLKQIQDAGRFGVSVLSAEQEKVSNLFAKSQDPERDRLRGARFTLSENGVVRLDDAIAYLDCQLARSFDGGDHDIVIGEVTGGRVNGDSAGAPLLFYRGRYARLSDDSLGD